MKLSHAFIITYVGFVSLPIANACTGVTVKTTDGTVISTRTMEFAMPMDSNAIYIPRGFKTAVKFTDGQNGASWNQKYAVLGINALGLNMIVEGFNEKGLNVGAFYLPGFAQYDKLTKENANKAIAAAFLPTWIAGNFATVEEVRKGLKDIVLVDSVAQGLPGKFPLHFRITDASGDQIVVEYVQNGMKIYDNPLGVITNSPEFDWHLTNLRNYMNLSATNLPSLKIEGVKLEPLGQGEGMHGLPGDYSPPSRYIRSMAIQSSALPVKTAEEGVNLSWHIINNTDIPIGTTRDIDPDGKPYLNYTQWTNVSDLKNLKLYFKTYLNQDVRVIDLKKIDLDSKEVKIFKMDHGPEYKDITHIQ
ncbi:linear amide C-N hydrolase [Candidatus Berkiella aquae]|uniref:Choloylglycine hydrolase n=1 Tax=Candidatus Berkiella aquae TaxID=295108 RepID=A0A0Q9YPT2_9GAMM|nr:choloylglycine hydrolase family protein [Candidatus Berkiella aquae]MCS5711918.1 choloylglycine hydrolase family protein [Candidatus Berkiella aquae]